jgi:hypothetical protein
MMIPRYELFVICSLLAGLVLGCGDKDGGNEQSDGASGSVAGGSDASGQGGGAGTTAGAGGSGGSKEQTPPPEMPRELGPPDGIHCESAFDPPSETCPAGSRCCPNDTGGDHEQVCIPDGGKCPACDSFTCGQLLCDGPEDCSAGQFCCFAKKGFCYNYEDCVSEYPDDDSLWISVDCRARCVGDQRDPDHGMVVCKDDRDCPGRYVAGRCQELNTGRLPYGLKACSGSGT